MKKWSLMMSLVLFSIIEISAQSVSEKLKTAFNNFENDPQLEFAISSLYVEDANTGTVVFSRNEKKGLAPASTQKMITSATALALLPTGYQYQTEFGIRKNDQKTILIIKPSFDPTLGSWRWEETKTELLFEKIKQAISKEGIKKIDEIRFENPPGSSQLIPDGWTWQDVGNYYGAGLQSFVWHENQYDLFLKSGPKTGDKVSVVDTDPVLHNYAIQSELSSAAKGTGDNAYIYLPIGGEATIVRGTIPVEENKFSISGAMINPAWQFAKSLQKYLSGELQVAESFTMGNASSEAMKKIYTYQSPALNSIIYWFNRRSINLYGEALIKTISYHEKKYASTDTGLVILNKFWKEKGINENELNMYDGSGLSPLNRVTTRAQVQVLKFARQQKWYEPYYESLPEFNGMKMKSGTINNVKAFCGYHRAANGKEYIFSFLVNNYNGSSGSLVQKMYKVLNVLK